MQKRPALRIAWPRLRLTLLEATAKKVRFMEHVAASLGLTDLQFVHGRAEELRGARAASRGL